MVPKLPGITGKLPPLGSGGKEGAAVSKESAEAAQSRGDHLVDAMNAMRGGLQTRLRMTQLIAAWTCPCSGILRPTELYHGGRK